MCKKLVYLDPLIDKLMKKETEKYYLALDLKEDPAAIEAYERYHRDVWPEVMESIRSSGIEEMEIYRVGNRLCMVIETKKDFSFDRKSQLDAENEVVKNWESLMDRFQQKLPFAPSGTKWMLMDKIFCLTEQIETL